MAISPWYKTSIPTAPVWTIQLVPDSGTFNTAGLGIDKFSLLMHNLDTGVETTGVGTFSNVTAAQTLTSGGITTILAPASVQYHVSVSDIPATIPANIRCWVLVTLASGIEPFLLEEDWEILPL